jgi:hypothetical protein
MGLVTLSRVKRTRSTARTARLRRLQAERTRRSRARASRGLICFTSELDSRGLEWLVQINAISEEKASNPNNKAVAQGHRRGGNAAD